MASTPPDSGKSYRTEITLAIIGLVSTVAVALIQSDNLPVLLGSNPDPTDPTKVQPLNPLPPETEPQPKTFTVTSTEHEAVANKADRAGEYFKFSTDVMDEILGTTSWDGETIRVRKENGDEWLVKIWRRKPGATAEDGVGHGRRNDQDRRPGDWTVGETVDVIGP